MSDTEVELQRIGSYIITRLLKNDTTSSLYLGKLRKKDIVIKVFHTPLITLEAKEAFLLRAKQLKKLKDRQIVELHDAGFIQDVDNNAGDQGYLVMQYVPGETLRQRVPPGQRIPADEVKRRLSPIASALHYAHVSNILHGNLHPGNLLIDMKDNTLLTDFSFTLQGLPIPANQPAAAVSYMAPEQLQGLLTAASDQYALAVMAYEWLCGQRPYTAIERTELLNQQTHDPLPPPCSLNSDISPAVEKVLLQALALNPDERFQHTQAFADNYLRALMGLPLNLETKRPAPLVLVKPVSKNGHHAAQQQDDDSLPVPHTHDFSQSIPVDQDNTANNKAPDMARNIPTPFQNGEHRLADIVTRDLCQGGILSQSLPGYEERPAQIEMATLVAHSLMQDTPTIIEAGTGTGKALDIDTPIPTPTGWKRMGDLVEGDVVFDEEGHPTRVMAAFDVMYHRKCYELVFSDGSSLIADAEHEWASYTCADRKWPDSPPTDTYTARNFVAVQGRLARDLGEQRRDGRAYTLTTTERMAATLTVSSSPRANHAIAVAGPLMLPDADLIIAPYFLGIWLGDGDSRNNQITTTDPSLIAEIEQEGYAVRSLKSHPYLYAVDDENGKAVNQRQPGMTGRLRALRLLLNKHIPETYLRASEQQRRALLAGLLDTNGTVNRNSAVEFTTTNPGLAQDVRELVCSLGFRPSLRYGHARLNGKDCSAKWTISFTTGEQVFRLERKAIAHKERLRNYSPERNRFRFVVAVREVPSRPVRCIQVESQSHLYLAGRSMIPTHNSLAYLVPIVRSGKVAIISTANKALQEQLFYKDIPFVQQHIKHFDAALVKGIGNYVCIDRLESERTGLQFYAKNRDFMRLVDITNDPDAKFNGDFETLDFQLPGDIRGKVCGDSDQCAWSKCNYFFDCYVRDMREKAARAQIIVVNHTLLLLDAAMDGFLLPERDVIVLDEAHHLEEEATRSFTITISENSVITLLAQKMLKNHTLLSLQDEANKALMHTWNRLNLVADLGFKGRANLQSPVEEGLKLATVITDLADSLRKQRPKDLPEKEGQLYDKLLKRTQNLSQNIRTVFSVDQPSKFVYYVERVASPGQRGFQLQVSAAPLDVTAWLKERLFDKCNVICTSATLATIGPNPSRPEDKGPNFSYFRRRTGLDSLERSEVIERILPLAFDFESNALLYVPRDLPTPVYGAGSDDYTKAIAREMYRLVKLSQGRAFLLFSSRRMLDQAYDLMAPHLDYPLLRQGDMPRIELTRQFREEKGAILFGLKSFWEGVDIVGEALSLVIIDKLPFDPPDDPVHEARVAQLKAAGENWFGIYVLPQAVLRLKQGLGRLLRTRDDRGVMAILDTRLYTKGYGKLVLEALPPARRTASIKDVDRFFNEEPAPF